jgi:hypothetical protein
MMRCAICRAFRQPVALVYNPTVKDMTCKDLAKCQRAATDTRVRYLRAFYHAKKKQTA